MRPREKPGRSPSTDAGGAGARSIESLRDLRRGQVIAAARGLIASQGLEGLTIAALESRLDFTRGVITYHFRDKDDIVRAVLESAVEDILAAARARVGERGTVPEKVAEVLRAIVAGFVGHPEAGRILVSFWSRIHAEPGLAALNAGLFASFRAQTAALLEAGRRTRTIGPIGVEATAALVVGLVIGIVTQATFAPGAIDVEAAVEEGARALLAHLAPRPRRRRR